MAASPFSLENKIAIVAGGGVGIGRSIAIEFAKAGADVVICSRKKENLEPVVAEITKLGRPSFRAKPEDISVNGWNTVIQINVNGVFFGCKWAAKQMMAQGGGGVIVNVSSIAGVYGSTMMSHYGTAKAGVINLTRALGMAWGRQGIRVNCIAPGPIETEGYLGVLTKQDPAAAKKAYDAVASRTGMGRWGKVHEIAYPCIFLASDASAFMNGATIIVDGGPSAREGDEAS